MGQICKSMKVDEQAFNLISLSSAIPDDEKTSVFTQNSNYKFLSTVDKKHRNSSSTIDPSYIQNDSRASNLEIQKKISKEISQGDNLCPKQIDTKNNCKPCIRFNSKNQQKHTEKKKKVSFSDFEEIKIVTNFDWVCYEQENSQSEK